MTLGESFPQPKIEQERSVQQVRIISHPDIIEDGKPVVFEVVFSEQDSLGFGDIDESGDIDFGEPTELPEFDGQNMEIPKTLSGKAQLVLDDIEMFRQGELDPQTLVSRIRTVTDKQRQIIGGTSILRELSANSNTLANFIDRNATYNELITDIDNKIAAIVGSIQKLQIEITEREELVNALQTSTEDKPLAVVIAECNNDAIDEFRFLHTENSALEERKRKQANGLHVPTLGPELQQLVAQIKKLQAIAKSTPDVEMRQIVCETYRTIAITKDARVAEKIEKLTVERNSEENKKTDIIKKRDMVKKPEDKVLEEKAERFLQVLEKAERNAKIIAGV